MFAFIRVALRIKLDNECSEILLLLQWNIYLCQICDMDMLFIFVVTNYLNYLKLIQGYGNWL